MENLTIKMEGEAPKEIIWREGAAVEPLPLKEPKIISLTGDIKSVSEFLSKRGAGFSSQAVDPNKVVVTSDKNGRIITMQLDPENHYGLTVTAKLEASEELKQFGINSATRYSRKTLIDLIRFNRLYFEDKTAHAKLCADLAKITFKAESERTQADDRRGNKQDSIEQKVSAPDGFTNSFVLTVPLFKGFTPEKITVEIQYDIMNGDISFWLESIGLKEATDGAIDGIFDTELENVKDYVIINK